MSMIPAFAHSARIGPLPPGIEIPGLTHGQMAVIARYRSDILDLADRQFRTDLTFRRILNYERIQFTYCLWGAVPGSITDEASPFNECSHAYLAALKALLDHMRTMPAATADANRLMAVINDDMYRNNAAWVLCQFSGEKFSTGEVIRPHWADVPHHLPSLLSLLIVLTMTGFVLWLLLRQSSTGASTPSSPHKQSLELFSSSSLDGSGGGS
ncbi:hypothetical protein [Aestuariivirga sp.]|uniref:hypothetical protein n=1 Tax=Aestuariivirga sp. TaxID=2650926 RepID=UPI0039E61AFB